MMKIELKILSIAMLIAMVMSSCGINRMVKRYQTEVEFNAAVNPLENHGGNVAADIKGSIAERYFARHAVLELTPVLKYEGGEKILAPTILRGTRTTVAGTMINNTQASAFEIKNSLEFKPEMLVSELVVRGRVFRQGRENRAVSLPERKVADGVINTSQSAQTDELRVAFLPDRYQKETIHTEKGHLYFAFMRHDINPRLALNRAPEAQAQLEKLRAFIRKGWQIKSIEVNGWASPEGEIGFNTKLAQNRSVSGERFLNNMLTQMERESRVTFTRPAFTVTGRGEDFDGFMAALEASNIPNKEALANAINVSASPAQRQRNARAMAVSYAEVEKLLAPLRRAEFVVKVYEPKKTDAQLLSLATTNPSELTLEELLYAATLTTDLHKKLAIYNAVKSNHPGCARGFNNAGVVNIQLGKIEEAKADLEQALKLAPTNKSIQNNLGVVAVHQGDLTTARNLFTTSGMFPDNLGIIALKEGTYAAAVTALAARTCTYNLALSQIMAGNQQAALATLRCAPQDAQTFYLMAVIAARANDTAALYENLRKAVAADAQIKGKAAKDREFVRFFNQPDFQAIVK